MKKNALNTALTVLYIIAVAVLILTFSIALPIYCRFFYYMQINPLGLPESTGLSFAEIKNSYDEVLNFLTFGGEFKTGVFPYSEEGMAHFYDCKALFDLNLIALIVSLFVTIILKILSLKKVVELKKFNGFTPSFYSGVAILSLMAIVGITAVIDFNFAFVTFHHIFFPGKTNWTFDEVKDGIIKILPEEFFLSCAILIIAAAVVICVSLIIYSAVKRGKREKKAI